MSNDQILLGMDFANGNDVTVIPPASEVIHSMRKGDISINQAREKLGLKKLDISGANSILKSV
jgi:hypothetical protein